MKAVKSSQPIRKTLLKIGRQEIRVNYLTEKPLWHFIRMKMFANENLFEPIIDYLRETGHDVISVREGLSGISDDEVYQLACKEKRVIITMDKDIQEIV